MTEPKPTLVRSDKTDKTAASDKTDKTIFSPTITSLAPNSIAEGALPRTPTREQLARWKAQAEEAVALLGQLPRGGCQPDRWQVLLDDTRCFVAAGWLDRARDLGWTQKDLFGVDCLAPWASCDHMGLIPALNGATVVGITDRIALVETNRGARQSFRRVPISEREDSTRITLLDRLGFPR